MRLTVSLRTPQVCLALVALTCGAAGCQAPAAAGTNTIKTESIYSPSSGRLEALKADTDGNGTLDAVAHMDGARLKDIEIDRNGDGNADRWEYYGPGAPQTGATNKFDRWAVIERAEEAAKPGAPRTRREFYEHGVIQRVEEDTDLDGRMDKWEFYAGGGLARVELDLTGKGVADQRLIYGPTGDVTRVEQDRDADGVFEPPAEQGRR